MRTQRVLARILACETASARDRRWDRRTSIRPTPPWLWSLGRADGINRESRMNRVPRLLPGFYAAFEKTEPRT